MWGRGEGRGGKGSSCDSCCASGAGTRCTEAEDHPSKLRAHVYASLAHASGHTHCERFVTDIGRFVAVVKVYWLARVARSAPAEWGGWPVVSGRTTMTASLQRTTRRAGRLGWGLGRYAQSTRGRDGRQTAERSQVRGFRRLWAWALASCDAGRPGLPAVPMRVRPQERESRAARRA